MLQFCCLLRSVDAYVLGMKLSVHNTISVLGTRSSQRGALSDW